MISDYGEWGRYNDQLAGPPPASFVEFVRSVAPPGARVLEFGIGAGRLALPLVEAGYEVTGVDRSRTMLDLLTEAIDDHQLVAIEADVTEATAFGTFDVVLLAYNLLSMLPSREHQRACLANAVGQLGQGGVIILENVAPRTLLDQFNERNQLVGVQFIDDNVWLNLGRYFPAEDRVRLRYLAFESGKFVERHGDLALISCEQVCDILNDLGMNVERRCASWDGTTYGADDAGYVVVARRAPAQATAAPPSVPGCVLGSADQSKQRVRIGSD